MHSVADRISGCTAALFCCIDRAGAALRSVIGVVATLTTSAAAVNGARIICCPPPAAKSKQIGPARAHENCSRAAETPRLWTASHRTRDCNKEVVAIEQVKI